MVLQDYFKIIFLLIGLSTSALSQTTEVRCINPKFDHLVDDYLSYSVETISVADAYESKQKFIFLDAREIEEYNISHINKAIHIGYDDFELKTLVEEIPKDAQLVIYCSIGYRSEKIGEILKKNGFQSVYNLYGSIFEWVNQHHPIYDQNGNLTNKLHTYNKDWSKWIEGQEIQRIW